MTQHAVEPEELQAYLDKELVPTRQGEVGRHIQDCRECSTMIADLRKVSTTLQNWKVEPAPAHLKPPVIPPEKSNAGLRWGRLALGLAGGFAVLLIAVAISVPNLLRSRMAADRTSQATSEDGPMMQQYSVLAPAPARSVRKVPESVLGSVIAEPRAPQPGRMVSYEVSMTVEVKEFEAAKSKVRQIMGVEGGYITNSNFVETPNQPKRAALVLRVPTVKLQTILNLVRNLGRVKEEHMTSEEVTEQVVDLEARLKNARTTEQRLVDVLNNRTAKVGDILEVEREISRTRGEIERMEGQRQNLVTRVEMATVALTLAEEFKAELQPAPVGTGRQLWNALVDGWENFSGSVLDILLFLARYGLTLVLWGGLSWVAWRLVRRPLLKRLLTQAG